MSIRTRIAPSPTGHVHIGTLRTALFNYFLAKQNDGGKFIIRIEDTDRERLVEGSVENLLSVLAELHLENDEGPRLDGQELVEEGDFGPYTQSKRLDLYKNFVQQLIDQGDAYYCFCTKERLDEMRAAQQETKQTTKYDRTCCSLSEDEVEKKLLARESHVVRMKIPEGETVVEDIVRGTVKFNNADVDDQVILKSDGFPTYHLAVVVDDHLMQISHVLRGEEWLSSTPKHIILYNMFGWEIPQFAHLPLLLNPDKTKLSKRQGDVAVEDYLKKGYLPEVLINFVGTLGFNPKADQEIYSMNELIKLFDLTKVNKSGAVMNMDKLNWMNNHYIKELSEDQLAIAAKPFVTHDVTTQLVRRAMKVESERIHTLTELNDRISPYVEHVNYDPEIIVWKKADAADAHENLQAVQNFLREQEDSLFQELNQLEEKMKNFIQETGRSNGNVLWPLRVALSGQERSASPFEYLWVLGKEESAKRIDKAIKSLV